MASASFQALIASTGTASSNTVTIDKWQQPLAGTPRRPRKPNPEQQGLLTPVSGGGSTFSHVKLLMGFEGTNGSTGAPGMNDESLSAHGTATVVNTTISTTRFKFGASSLGLGIPEGTGGNGGIWFPSSPDWNFGSGLFTVECFISPTSVSGQQYIVSWWDSFGDISWRLAINGSSLEWSVSVDGFNALTDMTGGTVVITTQQHVCVDFDGSKYRMYLEGAMVASFSTPRTIFDSSSAGPALYIGSHVNGTNFWHGYIDELRITKGVARYANDSGLTVPTAAFPRS